MLNFITISPTMKEPSFSKAALKYLKGYFVIDFIATILSNCLFLSAGYSAGLWAIRLKLFRIVRISYIRFAYKGIVTYATQHIPKIGKLIEFVITLSLESFFWLHILTCIWIKLGSLDAYEDRWKTMNEKDVSWMFIAGTDFTGDPAPIFE